MSSTLQGVVARSFGAVLWLSSSCAAPESHEQEESVNVSPANVEARRDAEICGSNDLLDVNSFIGKPGFVTSKEFVQVHKRSVGMIEAIRGSSTWVCSGTLVSANLFLTADHCDVKPGDKVAFSFENPGVVAPAMPGSRFTVASIAFTHWPDDVEGIILEDSPGLAFGFTRLAPADGPSGQEAILIQHPDGAPKQVDVGNVANGLLSGLWNYFNIDTLGGSSGAALLNTRGELIGIHHTGLCTQGNPPVTANSGTKLSVVRAAITAAGGGVGSLLVRSTNNSAEFVAAGGHAFALSPSERSALGINPADLVTVSDGALSAALARSVVDRTLLRSESGQVFVAVGNSPMAFATSADIAALGYSGVPAEPVPNTGIASMLPIPSSGKLLKDPSSGLLFRSLGTGLIAVESAASCGASNNTIVEVPPGSAQRLPFLGFPGSNCNTAAPWYVLFL